MLTYDIANRPGPIYEALYDCIKEDINQGRLKASDKMPSKRALAANLGVSAITVEKAYDQLIGEGYLYALPKRGYYVSDIPKKAAAPTVQKGRCAVEIPRAAPAVFDFSSNHTDSENFPFSIWAKAIRETMSRKERDLLTVPPAGGVAQLRRAIAGHLRSFRGMDVHPDQIVVGAGTEYLYGLIIQLLGADKVYCIENPGYKKLQRIYKSHGATCACAGMDDKGILVEELIAAKADVAHVSPTHHFPTGIKMPISRRYELLAWASEKDGRYIIEDDYDSEFRTAGRPIPALQSVDAAGRVIYMNTFSKSLSPTIRISYMVLPEELANRFYDELGFYSCTVSTFEQYALASFIEGGHFEKHINRMRSYYGKKRAQALDAVKQGLPEGTYQVIENDSGLHFIVKLHTAQTDRDIMQALAAKGIRASMVSDFEMDDARKHSSMLILNYSSMEMEGFRQALQELCNAAKLGSA